MSFGAGTEGKVTDTREKSNLAEDRTGTITTDKTRTQQLQLDDAAIERLIEDVLSGPGGLAEIFAGEQTAGIFGSTVAAQAAGDLTAKLVGELAKLTGETVTRDTGTETEDLTRAVAQTGSGFENEFGLTTDFGF